MLFLPGSNDTGNACQALQEREQSRPAGPTDSLSNALVALNVVYSVAFLASIPVVYLLRNEPRFDRIRPFSLTATLMVLAVFYVQGCLLPPRIPGFPCALMLFLHVLGYAAATGITCVRALVFVCESQYSLLASKELAVIREQASSASSVPSTKDDRLPTEDSLFHILKEVISVGFCFKGIDRLNLQVLSNLRRRYLAIFVCLFSPPFVVFAITVLVVPQYRAGCTDCDVTIEFFVTALAFPTVLGVMIVRFVYLGMKYEQDPQQVIRELFWTALTSPVWSYVGYALDMADPNEVAYNRQFAYSILVATGSLVFWFHSVFVQVVLAVRYRLEQSRRARSLQASPGGGGHGFLEECASDHALQREFYAYVTARYAIELLKFVDDARAYKLQFESRNDVWRKRKAQEIVNAYIKRDAPQQINLSETVRERVVRMDVEGSASKLLNMFDEALAEVTLLVNTGMWIEFKTARLKNKRRNNNNARLGPAMVAAEGD